MFEIELFIFIKIDLVILTYNVWNTIKLTKPNQTKPKQLKPLNFCCLSLKTVIKQGRKKTKQKKMTITSISFVNIIDYRNNIRRNVSNGSEGKL